MLCAHDRTTIDVRCTRSVVNWKSDTAALTLASYFLCYCPSRNWGTIRAWLNLRLKQLFIRSCAYLISIDTNFSLRFSHAPNHPSKKFKGTAWDWTDCRADERFACVLHRSR